MLVEIIDILALFVLLIITHNERLTLYYYFNYYLIKLLVYILYIIKFSHLFNNILLYNYIII